MRIYTCSTGILSIIRLPSSNVPCVCDNLYSTNRYINVCICKYIYVYICYTFIHMQIYICVHMLYIYIYICIYYTFIYTYVYIGYMQCIYIYIYISIYWIYAMFPVTGMRRSGMRCRIQLTLRKTTLYIRKRALYSRKYKQFAQHLFTDFLSKMGFSVKRLYIRRVRQLRKLQFVIREHTAYINIET